VDVEIFNDWGDPNGGLYYLSKYGHVLSGIAWIGLLYFFNFVQVPAFAELSAEARGEALRKVTWRALWWFRWAALATFLTGVIMIGILGEDFKPSTSSGLGLYWGVILAVTMFLNVWGVIWVNQKINIGSANTVAAGGQADPRVPVAAKKAARASRLNTMFSIPMLFFMLWASHWGFRFEDPDGGKAVLAWIIFLAIWAFAEASALGFIGGLDSPFNKLVFDTHKNTIIAGFVILAVLYFICWELVIGGLS
jgi:uncharacterized membrane protein